MKTYNLNDYLRGWFIGNFEPSIFQTSDFEVALMRFQKGEFVEKHIHKIATEYNVLVSGSMTIMGKKLAANDIFVIYPGEIADPVYHEDSVVLVVKVPSVKGDKYKVET
jgi:hypothetical protein